MLLTERPLEALRNFDQIVDNQRTRFYNRLLDKRLTTWLTHFDLDRFPWGEHDDVKDNHQVGLRGATNMTALLAFCWANPMSDYYRDDRLLAQVKSRLLEFAKNQKDGAIIYKTVEVYKHFDNYSPLRNNLGIAWSIEPLVLAANWIADELTEDETRVIRQMARRTADLLAALPCNEANNRGAVRCAVLCLLGQYLNDRTLIDTGVHDFHREPRLIFNPNGQINEGPGPDGNYSGTSFIYCYTYRIFSNDITVDAGLRNGARWYTWAADSFGAPTYMGASTRIALAAPGKVSDFIPAMERYAGDFPSFHWLIEQGYLRSIEKSSTGHVVSPLIWAFFEHNGESGELSPDWFTPANLINYNRGAGPEFHVSNEGTDSLYLVLRGRDNHSSTSLTGRFPYKGLQTWNYKLEQPVVWPTVTHASKTRAFGVDTARMRIEGSKFTDRRWYEGEQGKPNLLITRTGEVMSHYLQTATTLIYLSSCSLNPREDIFIIDPKRCGEPLVADGVLQYEGRAGRMFFAGPQPEITKRDNSVQLTFTGMGRTGLYAFSNDSFQLLEFSPEGDTLRFRDDTGIYRLDYEIRGFNDDDLAPIGSKGFGVLYLSQLVKADITVEDGKRPTK